MADQKISADPDASALTGAEIVPMLQGGGNVKASLTTIQAFIGVTGPTGPSGQDSTVTGPTGPAGPAGSAGVPGVQPVSVTTDDAGDITLASTGSFSDVSQYVVSIAATVGQNLKITVNATPTMATGTPVSTLWRMAYNGIGIGDVRYHECAPGSSKTTTFIFYRTVTSADLNAGMVTCQLQCDPTGTGVYLVNSSFNSNPLLGNIGVEHYSVDAAPSSGGAGLFNTTDTTQALPLTLTAAMFDGRLIVVGEDSTTGSITIDPATLCGGSIALNSYVAITYNGSGYANFNNTGATISSPSLTSTVAPAQYLQGGQIYILRVTAVDLVNGTVSLTQNTLGYAGSTVSTNNNFASGIGGTFNAFGDPAISDYVLVLDANLTHFGVAPYAGNDVRIRLIQDATGGRTIANPVSANGDSTQCYITGTFSTDPYIANDLVVRSTIKWDFIDSNYYTEYIGEWSQVVNNPRLVAININTSDNHIFNMVFNIPIDAGISSPLAGLSVASVFASSDITSVTVASNVVTVTTTVSPALQNYNTLVYDSNAGDSFKSDVTNIPVASFSFLYTGT